MGTPPILMHPGRTLKAARETAVAEYVCTTPPTHLSLDNLAKRQNEREEERVSPHTTPEK